MGAPGAHRLYERPLVAEHVAVGACVAVLGVVAEGVAHPLRSEQAASVGDLALSAVHLLAMYLPVGLVVGLAVGVLLSFVRNVPVVRRARQRFSLTRPAPRAFALGVAGLGGLAVLFFATVRTAHHFATRYHDADLASHASAAATVAVVLASVVATLLLWVVMRPVSRALGRVACGSTLLLLWLAAVGGIVALLAVRFPELFRVYDPVRLAWLPGLAVVYVFVAALVAWRRRRAARAARMRVVAGAAAVAGLALVFFSGVTYGDHHRVRRLLEHESVAGLRLVHSYASLTDRDRDGHSFAFGGGDCDDSDRRVYPGAPDPIGDGVDADCFDGDGSRDVADFANGGYGRVPPTVNRPNVLLITVDALRGDHTNCFGYERPTSPSLEEFCNEAVAFEQVVAQSSRSIRSIPAMFTGMYPSQIAYGDEYLWPGLLPENHTVAESFEERGYRTAVVMGTSYFNRSRDFFQGFTEVDQDAVTFPPRERVVTDAIEKLDDLASDSRPWFLWAHLYNVHLPYLVDRPSRFGNDPMGRYDTEITLADAEVKRLLDDLKGRGLWDDTVVVIASDHGEAFGEHDNAGHSHTLYEEELRAFLAIRVPGIPPRIVEQPVGLFDVAPTLMNVLRVPVPRPMPARSLIPLMTGDGELEADRLLFSELMPDGQFPFDQKAIRRGDDKLIWWVREGRVELYDLAADPLETVNLADDRPELRDELLGLLRAWVSSTNRPEHIQRNAVNQNRLHREPSDMTGRLDVRFPIGFTLLGYDLPESTFERGDSVPITLYYRVDRQMDEDLYILLALEGPPGFVDPGHMHANHYPMHGRYHTNQWREGEILRDPTRITLPRTLGVPVTLKITLRIRAEDRSLVPFDSDPGTHTLHLDEIQVR